MNEVYDPKRFVPKNAIGGLIGRIKLVCLLALFPRSLLDFLLQL